MQNQFDDEIKDGKDQDGNRQPSENYAGPWALVLFGAAAAIWTALAIMAGYFLKHNSGQ